MEAKKVRGITWNARKYFSSLTSVHQDICALELEFTPSGAIDMLENVGEKFEARWNVRIGTVHPVTTVQWP
jgi:hypothetical protein